MAHTHHSAMDPRRREYLQRMGLTVWLERRPAPAAGPAAAPPPEPAAAPEAALDAAGSAAAPLVPAAAPATAPAAPPPQAPPAPEIEASPGDAQAVEALDWDALRQRVAACTACGLQESRTRTVFGVGDPRARLMVVGEAPGADEDRQGEPFVGRAGRLLNAMLQAVGLPREAVYIANILKCRPPRNRDPQPGEVACCEGYLRRQVALVGPRVILTVGRVAAQSLLRTEAPLGRLRGGVRHLPGTEVPVVVTYHPAYLLRSPGDKAKAWLDLKAAWRLARGGGAAAGDRAPPGGAS